MFDYLIVDSVLLKMQLIYGQTNVVNISDGEAEGDLHLFGRNLRLTKGQETLAHNYFWTQILRKLLFML